MEELLISITKGLVDNPEQVSVDVNEPNEEGVNVYHLHVAESDMGRVIGKNGKIAQALRAIVKTASAKSTEKSAFCAGGGNISFASRAVTLSKSTQPPRTDAEKAEVFRPHSMVSKPQPARASR